IDSILFRKESPFYQRNAHRIEIACRRSIEHRLWLFALGRLFTIRKDDGCRSAVTAERNSSYQCSRLHAGYLRDAFRYLTMEIPLRFVLLIFVGWKPLFHLQYVWRLKSNINL